MAFMLGLGAAMLASWVVIISVTAVSILDQKRLWVSIVFMSMLKGIVRTFPPGWSSHSLSIARSMWLNSDVGPASWIGGISPRVYLSIATRAGCFPLLAWLVAASSSWVKMVFLVGGGSGIPNCRPSPKLLSRLGVLTTLGCGVVAGVCVCVFGISWGICGVAIVVSGSSSHGLGIGVLTIVLG